MDDFSSCQCVTLTGAKSQLPMLVGLSGICPSFINSFKEGAAKLSVTIRI